MAGMLWLPASLVAQDSTPPPGVTIHVVQRGENLYRIALEYGLTVDQLAQLNGLADPDNIEVGQRLLVPTEATALPPQTHIVQPGESLDSIARLYNADALLLANMNNVTAENPLYVGQVLTIASDALIAPSTDAPPSPEPTTPAAALPEPQRVLHTVLEGETLFRIATAYGVTVADVAAANGISDPSVIYAGQQLLIPGVQPPQIALDLPDIVSSLTVTPLILVEGQTGQIRLITNSPASVTGTFIGKPLNVASEQGNTRHTILVGVPIFTEAGIYPLSLVVTGEGAEPQPIEANIQIVTGSYGSEYINLLADRENLLDTNVENAELTLISTIMSNFTTPRHFDGPMGLPAAAAMTSPFGTRRSYNGGGFDRFHAGTDFAGAPGTPILASAPGTVVLADTLNVRGNATIIDHGWGIYTGYWHQTERYVQPGDFVTTGQVIGTIGATGRVTGAHLHWELWVNGTPVDPMQWVRQPFS